MLGIYCRTSNAKQDRYTIPYQREEGIKCAEKLNIRYKIYDSDEGISGTLDEKVREGLSDLFDDIKKSRITHVFCIDQSRIERNTRTWDFFVSLCIIHKVKFYQGGNYFDLESPSNLLLANLMSIINSYYAEITSKKVRDANARKAAAGKTHGLKPYGYKKGPNNFYEIDKDEAAIVQRMFQMSLNGIGAYTIANILNEEGVPTKFSKNFKGQITRKDKYTKLSSSYEKSNVLWRGNVISSILRNKMYKGIREWQKHKDVIHYENDRMIKRKVPDELIIYKDIPVIVSPKLWDAVNANLIVNRKNVGKNEQYHYLLNGLLFCGHCKSEMIGKKRLKGNDNAYKCKGVRSPRRICNHSRGISLPKLENFVIQHLFYSKGLKKLLVEAPKQSTHLEKLRKDKIKNEKSLSESKKEVMHFRKLMLNPKLGDKDIEYFANALENSKNRIVQLEAIIENLIIQIEELENETRKKRTKSLISSYSEGIEFEELKRLVHSLIDNITITHVKENKSGHFNLVIKYKNYDEYSYFATNWQAVKWLWLSYYRKEAYTKEQKNDDYELAAFLLKRKGYKPTQMTEFKGFTSVSAPNESINLNPDELLIFDAI